MAILLGELLLRAKVLSEAQVETALSEQKKWGGKLGQILVRMGYLSEDLLTKALSKQLGIQRVDLSKSKPGANALRKVNASLAENYGVLPLELRDQGNTLLVAMADPKNLRALDELRAATGCKIDPLLAGESEIRKTIARVYASEDLREGGGGGDEFKIVDSQGNTVMRKLEDILPPSAPLPPRPPVSLPPPPIAQTPAPPPHRPPPPLAASAAQASTDPLSLLEKVEKTQRKEVQVLKALVELLIERGVFSREDYLSKVSRR